MLIELLRPEYELIVAPDGERAWEMAVQMPPPDMVLSDVEMPGVGGIEIDAPPAGVGSHGPGADPPL